MPWPVIAPFLRPTMEPNTAAQSRVFQRRQTLLPARRNRRFLLRGDVARGPPARGVVPVRIIDLDPMSAVVGAVIPVEFAPVFTDDKVHPFRSLVVALYRLLPFTLAEADVVLAFHTPVLIEAHFVAALINQDQR